MKPAQTQRLVARSPMAEQLDREAWLAKRLGDHGVAEIFAGLTDPAVRRERFREVILARGLECVIVGRGPDRKPESYAQTFERLYGEPLDPGDGNKRKSAAPKNSPHSAPSRLHTG